MHTECISDCDTVCSFLKLTDEMVKTILELDEELIRWRPDTDKISATRMGGRSAAGPSSITHPVTLKETLHTIYMSDWSVAVKIHNRWLPEPTGCTGLPKAPMRTALRICNY